jgi:hypothetical protein
MGIAAVMSVPPSVGLSTRSWPSRAARRSASPRRPLPSGRAPPIPSSRTLTASVPASIRAVPSACPARACLATGQSFRDQEVGGRLDRRGEPAHGHVDLDRHRHPRGQRLHSRVQTAVGEDRRQDAVRELAQLGRRLLGVPERLGQQAVVLLALLGALGRLQRDDGVDQKLVSAVVQIANHAPALLVGCGHDPRSRRRQLPVRFGVCDGRGDQLRERGELRLAVGR